MCTPLQKVVIEMRHRTLIATVAACAALGVTPALASTSAHEGHAPSSSHVKLPLPETEAILNGLTARLNHQRGAFPAPGNNDFDGYNVISDVGPARELTTV